MIKMTQTNPPRKKMVVFWEKNGYKKKEILAKREIFGNVCGLWKSIKKVGNTDPYLAASG